LLGIVGGLLVLMKLHSLIMPDSTDLEDYSLKNFKVWEHSNSTKPKVAFMFIARQQMPLDILWEHFFDVKGFTCFSLLWTKRILVLEL